MGETLQTSELVNLAIDLLLSCLCEVELLLRGCYNGCSVCVSRDEAVEVPKARGRLDQ